MKDYRQLFGIAAIIMACGFLVRSFQPAHAVNGPTVSMGSNPIDNIYGAETIGGYNSSTVFTNNTNHDFIITQFRSISSSCALEIDGATVFSHYNSSYGSKFVYMSQFFEGNLKVSIGSIISIQNNSGGTSHCPYYIEGYYAHTP